MDKFFLIFFVAILCSCTYNKEQGVISDSGLQPHLVYLPVDNDFNPQTTVFYNRAFISLQKNGSVTTIDPNGRLSDDFKQALSSKKFHNIYRNHDTLFARVNDSIFYFSSEWNYYSKLNRDSFIAENLALEDNQYIMYSLCAGEYGGSLFILDKKSSVTYSLPLTCPVSVYREGTSLVVTEVTFHGNGSSSVVRINDINSLTILPDSLTQFANWSPASFRSNTTVDTTVIYTSKNDSVFFTGQLFLNDELIFLGIEKEVLNGYRNKMDSNQNYLVGFEDGNRKVVSLDLPFPIIPEGPITREESISIVNLYKPSGFLAFTKDTLWIGVMND